MLRKNSSGGKVLIGAMFGVLASASLGGCVFVPANQGPVNYPPYIDQPYVTCAWDGYYQTYVWDFFAFIDDSNGYGDVTSAYVDVIDAYNDPYSVAESWPLAYDGQGDWSQTIYEYNGSGDPSQYSHVLDCEYLRDFEFDFTAIDYYGSSDVVTYVP